MNCKGDFNRIATTTLLVILLTLPALGTLQGQDAGTNQTIPENLLLRGFDSIRLGMVYDDALSALETSSYIHFRGPRDVSLRPLGDDPIISAPGQAFLQEVVLQFSEGVLFSISLVVDPQEFDYGTFYRIFNQRYGNPHDLNPRRAVWQDEQTRISIEKPLTVQFLDLGAFRRMQEDSMIQDSAERFSKTLFLDEFR